MDEKLLKLFKMAEEEASVSAEEGLDWSLFYRALGELHGEDEEFGRERARRRSMSRDSTRDHPGNTSRGAREERGKNLDAVPSELYRREGEASFEGAAGGDVTGAPAGKTRSAI